jgi:hypothetical protein
MTSPEVKLYRLTNQTIKIFLVFTKCAISFDSEIQIKQIKNPVKANGLLYNFIVTFAHHWALFSQNKSSKFVAFFVGHPVG